jgi:SAM-dependent methyltransferase
MKDLFSEQAAAYRIFRPVYPPALYDFLLSQCDQRDLACDVGTGNGQVAAHLAQHFAQVYASDISEKQLAEAPQMNNIAYHLAPAENIGLPADSVDLLTVAQAMHWFDFDRFFAECDRVLRPGGLLAAWGYDLVELGHAEINQRFRHFYDVTIGEWWDPERRYIDEAYTTIDFPFEKIETPTFSIENEWNLDALEGFLNTWSAVNKYIKVRGINPADALMAELRRMVPADIVFPVRFPVFVHLRRK